MVRLALNAGVIWIIFVYLLRTCRRPLHCPRWAVMFVIMQFRYVDKTVDRRMSNILKFSEIWSVCHPLWRPVRTAVIPFHLTLIVSLVFILTHQMSKIGLACLYTAVLFIRGSSYSRFLLSTISVICYQPREKTIQENRIYLSLTRGRVQVARYESEQDWRFEELDTHRIYRRQQRQKWQRRGKKGRVGYVEDCSSNRNRITLGFSVGNANCSRPKSSTPRQV